MSNNIQRNSHFQQHSLVIHWRGMSRSGGSKALDVNINIPHCYNPLKSSLPDLWANLSQPSIHLHLVKARRRAHPWAMARGWRPRGHR
ncbi:hypothetical protein I7I53_02722 [Histoplasma capsulatum var. duboisii H88]|uniref:Uncharacterized protein n=1 Tax=Ajellomyces capsulatus (strain H88) TaxID=544711 RepID=A0A8A1LMA7_AJEC8|nr:hypothetical protein I7I53_02722 [Histoplasma capsulatum var. duboisii H88]